MPVTSASLYEGFEGYQTPTNEDYRRVLVQGLVIPDANVLLNLYRYNQEARADLLAVLSKLGDQLWVPHQVLTEFWRNRESAINDPQDSAARTADTLGSLLEDAEQAIRTWSNRGAAPKDHVEDLVARLQVAFDVVSEEVQKAVDPRELDQRRDTNSDRVLRELEPLLAGRVGPPLAEEDHRQAVEEGLRRVDSGEPPGYQDQGKPGEASAGDYLIWEQVLIEAQKRGRDVLLVTGDVKEDWWRRERGQVRGPRLELVAELRARAGTSLFMMRPETLLRHAEEFLEIEVREESVQDAERVAFLVAAESQEGWTADALVEALKQLDVRAPVQAAVIRFALDGDGFVPREVVYELGGYGEDRSLRGFTRPTSRVSQELQETGLLAAGSKNILEAVYDPKISYVQASGFRIPPELRRPTTQKTSTNRAPTELAED